MSLKKLLFAFIPWVIFAICYTFLFIYFYNLNSEKRKKYLEKIVESGYYKYCIRENGVSIVGLTSDGLSQKTIVIPNELDGYKVISIGYIKTNIKDNRENMFSNNQLNEKSKLENIYICGQVSLLETTYDYFYRNDIMNGYFCSNSRIKYYNVKNNYGYLEKKESNYRKANVVYYLNNGTNEPFFVDNCADSIVNVLPPDPIRDGYKFAGWYKESDCLNKWDFENDVVNSETKIYAKWEMNA